MYSVPDSAPLNVVTIGASVILWRKGSQLAYPIHRHELVPLIKELTDAAIRLHLADVSPAQADAGEEVQP